MGCTRKGHSFFLSPVYPYANPPTIFHLLIPSGRATSDPNFPQHIQTQKHTHIATALVPINSLVLNPNWGNQKKPITKTWKYWGQERFWRLFFFSQKQKTKKQSGSAWNYPLPSTTVYSTCFLFHWPLVFKQYLNHHVRIKKW